MAHPRIIRAQMLDWIKNSLDLAAALPTDAQIVDRFNLTGVESARSLLAELADAGEITIKGYGPGRKIMLGRTVERPAAERPLPSVVKRSAGKRVDADVEAATAKIRDILSRGKKAVEASPPVAAPVQVSPAVVSPPADDGASEGAQVRPSPARVPAPHPIVGMEMPRPPEPVPEPLAIKRLPTAPGQKLGRPRVENPVRAERRQLNIHFPNEQFERLTEIANGAGTSAAAYARSALIGCLNRKPRIPAQVAAAALRDGFPVVDFAHRMMVLGLAAYAHEMAGEVAA